MRPTPANARPSGMVAASSVRVHQYDTRKEANSGSRSACQHDPPAAHHVIPAPITRHSRTHHTPFPHPSHATPAPITRHSHTHHTPLPHPPRHSHTHHAIPAPITSFPHPSHAIPTPITRHSRTHHVIPAPITRHSHTHHTPLPHPSHATPAPITPLPHPSRHSREGGNPAACVRRHIHGNTDTVVLVCLDR